MKLNYWTGTSGLDPDDGIWNQLAGSFSQAVLQSKLRVVGPGTSVPRRFSAWAVRHAGLTAIPEPATIALLGIGLAGLGGMYLRRRFRRQARR